MDVVPGDDVVEAGGGGLSDGEEEPPIEGYLQQPEDLLALLTSRQERRSGCAAILGSRVWMLRL